MYIVKEVSIYIYIHTYIYMNIFIGSEKVGPANGPEIGFDIDTYPFFLYDQKEPFLNAQAIHLAIYFACKEVLTLLLGNK
jgi:hypothetical protein